MGISVRDLETTLRGFGASKICDYHQRGRGSYCRGMCLDWIRRILNAKGSTYNYLMTSRDGKRAFDRQVATHNIFQDATRSNNAVLGDAKKVQNVLGWKKTFGTLMFWTSEAELKEKMRPAEELSEAIDDKGFVEATWKDFAPAWKQQVRSSKTGRAKVRQMDAFNILGSPYFQLSAATSAAAYIEEAIDKLRPDDCALIDVLFNEGSGHAFAFHKTQAGTFELFDPNYGIFSVTEASALVDSMTYLFDRVYPSHEMTVKGLEFVQMWM